uniref:Uncharacterized protein n=1 Tax=Oryza glaberrima TaxID=4538 RepID=I1QU48_ORYGL
MAVKEEAIELAAAAPPPFVPRPMWPLLADGGKRKKQSGCGGRIPALNTLTPLELRLLLERGGNGGQRLLGVRRGDGAGVVALVVGARSRALRLLLWPAAGCTLLGLEAASAYDPIKRMIPVAEEVVKTREIVTKGGAAGSRPCPPIPVIPSEANRGGRGRGGDAEDG